MPFLQPLDYQLDDLDSELPQLDWNVEPGLVQNQSTAGDEENDRLPSPHNHLTPMSCNVQSASTPTLPTATLTTAASTPETLTTTSTTATQSIATPTTATPNIATPTTSTASIATPTTATATSTVDTPTSTAVITNPTSTTSASSATVTSANQQTTAAASTSAQYDMGAGRVPPTPGYSGTVNATTVIRTSIMSPFARPSANGLHPYGNIVR